jgi:4-hydroxybenzoate polyprenyltransferase
MTFSREIIKDIEDEGGDKTINANTLIIRLGLFKTKLIITSLNLLVFTLIGVWQYFQYSFSQTLFSTELSHWGTDTNSILYTFLLQILLLFYIVKCCISHSKENFSFLSKFAKLIMIAGILSIAFFTYNH